jgi:hypothetical protein
LAECTRPAVVRLAVHYFTRNAIPDHPFAQLVHVNDFIVVLLGLGRPVYPINVAKEPFDRVHQFLIRRTGQEL